MEEIFYPSTHQSAIDRTQLEDSWQGRQGDAVSTGISVLGHKTRQNGSEIRKHHQSKKEL